MTQAIRWPLRAAVLGLAVGANSCLVSFADLPVGDLGGSGIGGSGAAGAAGAAGAVSAAGGSGTAGANSGDLIDDFEAHNDQVALLAGRDGHWYVSNDGTGTEFPNPTQQVFPTLLPPARGTSRYGLNVSGTPFTVWGALVGANFAVTNNVATLYDVSPYQGVQFYARLGTKPSVNTVRFELTTYETQMAPGCTTCGDHFGVSVPLTANFVLYQEPFGALTQTGTGVPQVPAIDLEKAYGIQFAWGKNEAFDIWLDDISFY